MFRLAAAAACAASSAAAALPPLPPRVLDAHVHLTDTTRFAYSDWANASLAGACPCAPPCPCDWGVADFVAASRALTPSAAVFIEVDADPQMWFDEAAWAQGIADAGGAGPTIGAVVAKAPPGFGTRAVSDAAMGAQLDRLRGLPLARGVRTYLNWTAHAEWPAVVNHTRLLGARSLHLEVCLGTAGGDAAAAAALIALTDAAPGVTFVVDHAGSPPALGGAAALAAWRQAVSALGTRPNVFMKFGGLYQYFKTCLTCPSTFPSTADVAPLALHALASFPMSRLIWEGNWFFVDWFDPRNLDVYSTWVAATMEILGGLQPAPTADDLADLFFRTGAYAYRIAAP